MKTYSEELKERIVADYLSGGGSYRELSKKYGIGFQLINQWVMNFKASGAGFIKPELKEEEKLPSEVTELQEQLRQARLYNQLLESLIDIGKEKYGIDLRKKNGTKQS